jgi:nucleotide-binding universal stress UspA family protein
MTFLVAFDGSELAEAALVRAVEFNEVLGDRVVAVTIVPDGNRSYARERGWLDAGEPFDREAILASVHEQVSRLAPAADFVHRTVDEHATAGTIASRLRTLALDEEATMVFVGSENAGRLATTLSSVGGTVAAADAYDVVIVRHPRPSAVAAVRERSPFRREKSEFFLIE